MTRARMRAGGAAGLLEAVASRAGSPERALAAASLSARDLVDPDQFLDLDKLIRLFDCAAQEARDDTLALRLGLTYDLAELGALSYAVLNAPTVDTALRNLERYAHTHMPGVEVAVTVEGDACTLLYNLPLSDRETCRQNSEAAAAVALQLLRRLAGPDWRPRRVLFGHRRPRDTAVHEQVFGVLPTFGADVAAALLFDAKTLDQAVPGADRRLLPIVQRHLDELLASVGGADAWLSRLRALVARSVCDGHPAIEGIARRVGLSERTLQRRLGERGLLWKDVVLDVRRELAQGYLSQSETSLTEIAFLLGYSELSAFDRAFRKWTGVTPMEWRRRAARGPAGQWDSARSS